MQKQNHHIGYFRYHDRADLPTGDRILLEEARETLPQSYAPYSKFAVSAAIRLTNGLIVAGTNQENASLGLSLCAEQNVLSEAGSKHGSLPVEALAVTVHYSHKLIDYPITPCGACRQVIREHEVRHQHPIRIILQGMTGHILVFESITELLPFSFNPGDLLM